MNITIPFFLFLTIYFLVHGIFRHFMKEEQWGSIFGRSMALAFTPHLILVLPAFIMGDLQMTGSHSSGMNKPGHALEATGFVVLLVPVFVVAVIVLGIHLVDYWTKGPFWYRPLF